MIYADSILNGYICLRGTLFLHFPMFIAMIVFIQIPSDDINVIFAAPWVHVWYYISLFLHFFIAILHYALSYVRNLSLKWESTV